MLASNLQMLNSVNFLTLKKWPGRCVKGENIFNFYRKYFLFVQKYIIYTFIWR